MPNPANPQSWNRFAYTLNNPLRYTDPTGHWVDEGCGSGELCELPVSDDDGGGNGGGDNSVSEIDETEEKPWSFSRQITAGFHIGPTSAMNSPDIYGDYIYDPAVCQYAVGPAAIPCAAAVAARFPSTYGPKDTSNNFWMHFSIDYDETIGISVSDVEFVNYYKSPAYLQGMMFESSDTSIIPRHEYFGKRMPSGFGSSFVIPGPTKPFDGNHPLTIKFEVKYFANNGGTTNQFTPDYSINLPSLPNLKLFIEAGKIPSNPIYFP